MALKTAGIPARDYENDCPTIAVKLYEGNLVYNANMYMVTDSSVVMDLIGLVYLLIIDQSYCLHKRSQKGTETSSSLPLFSLVSLLSFFNFFCHAAQLVGS